MKKIALSKEQMERLKELGVSMGGASLYYYHGEELTVKDEFYEDFGFEQFGDIPAFTLQDILEILPVEVWIESDVKKNGNKVYNIHYPLSKDSEGDAEQICWDENPLEAAYNLLVWCIENQYI